MRAYARPETWQAAADSLQALAQDPVASGVPNGQALLQAEFLRRNTVDFWWLHARLLHPSGPSPLAAISPSVILGVVSAILLRLADRRRRQSEDTGSVGKGC